MRSERLNPRLSVAAEFVRQGATFADIGTDHAYLPLFLLGEGRIERAICSDINEGPLESARRNAAERGLLDKCEFLLCDGAEALSGKGITDYAICGMGGELIADIISRQDELRDSRVSLILQPMTRQSTLRKFLFSEGFSITAEGYSYDAGRYYVCMLAKYTGASREINAVEAEIGIDGIEIVNKSEQKGYLLAKKESLIRAVNGKRLGGESTEEEEKILSAIAEKIERLG